MGKMGGNKLGFEVDVTSKTLYWVVDEMFSQRQTFDEEKELTMEGKL